MFHATLIIMSRKYFFRLSKFATTLRYTILDSRFPPENAISEGRPPLCKSSSEAGALPSEVRIENDLDRKFSKSKVFLKTTFLHDSCYPVHYLISYYLINRILKIGKIENFNYKINENCPIGITKIGKK